MRQSHQITENRDNVVVGAVYPNDKVVAVSMYVTELSRDHDHAFYLTPAEALRMARALIEQATTVAQQNGELGGND